MKAENSYPRSETCDRCVTVDWPQINWEDNSCCDGVRRYLFNITEPSKELWESSCPLCFIWVPGEIIDKDAIAEDRGALREVIMDCTCHFAEPPPESTDSSKSRNHPLNSVTRHVPLVRVWLLIHRCYGVL